MILKIPNFSSGWKWFDGLTQVEYSFIDRIDDKELFDYKVLIQDSKKRIIHIHGNNKTSGKVLNIAVNQTCYILNDEGKTIERLL